jgi:transcriptional antiterminator RfaH
MNSENKDLNFIDIENWYAVYTKPRSEKKLDALLKKFSIEAYLPLLKLKKKWSDRTKIISMPLFTSYIFVRIVYRESYLKVLNIPHAVGFVKSYGNPAIIPESEIELIKSLVDEFPDKIKVLESEMLQKGNEVTIKTGPFAGRKAIVDRVKNETYVLLEIKTIQKILKIEINKENLDLEIKL